MKVLIIGANGKIGQILAEKLNKSDAQPIAMIRKQEQEEKFTKQGIATVLADLEQDFGHAFEGIDVVVFSAGSGAHTGKEKTHLVDQEGAKKAIDLAVKNNIKHFVMVSALGADYSSDQWPEHMKHYYEAKADADQYLMQSGINYTIIKPGRLTDEEGNGSIEIGKRISKEINTIPRKDVATVITKVVSQGLFPNQSLELLSGHTPIDQALAEVAIVAD